MEKRNAIPNKAHNPSQARVQKLVPRRRENEEVRNGIDIGATSRTETESLSTETQPCDNDIRDQVEDNANGCLERLERNDPEIHATCSSNQTGGWQKAFVEEDSGVPNYCVEKERKKSFFGSEIADNKAFLDTHYVDLKNGLVCKSNNSRTPIHNGDCPWIYSNPPDNFAGSGEDCKAFGHCSASSDPRPPGYQTSHHPLIPGLAEFGCYCTEGYCIKCHWCLKATDLREHQTGLCERVLSGSLQCPSDCPSTNG